MTRVCIGIHVLEQPEQLQQTLKSVRANTATPFSLLLLPDGPDEATAAVLAGMSDVQQLEMGPASGGAAAFNRLVKNTDSDVVVLLESGARAGPGWLEHILRALESNPAYGLAGPSTNRCWNEQAVFPNGGPTSSEVMRTAQDAVRRFGGAHRTLEPLYSLADFCYVVRRSVFDAIGEADEAYGPGPCWEMDYNIRAARAGFQGVWVGASYVYRAPFCERRRREEALRFEASKQRYQDKFCGMRLRGQKTEYRSHCRGDACHNFAPWSLIAPQSLIAGPLPFSAAGAGTSASSVAVQPLVSCIMPTRNRREFIPRALECFRRQNYPNLELVIVDSGSDPIHDLVSGDSRIQYFQAPCGLTIGALRNYACQRARGEIIVHWDDDDWYPPHRVRAQLRPLMEDGINISGTSRLHYYEARHRRAFLYQYSRSPRRWVAGNTLAYRRSFWQANPFPNLQVGEDSRFVWNAPQGSVIDLNDPGLCVASIHAGNASPKNTQSHYWRAEPVEHVLGLMSAADGPLVSCIMPTFNRRSFIPLALACFRAQTYPRKELVVVDDGSDAVADLFHGSPEVRYLRAEGRLTIGAKRNLACLKAQGEIIAHWDDDDWYAPQRLEMQVAPLLAGTADITGLTNRFVLEMPRGRFWTTAEGLHRRMFVGDVHGGTLVYHKSILEDCIRYPEVNIAEDAALVQQAIRRNKRLVRLENPGVFVYLRHGHNAWKFETGQFIDPSGWSACAAPSGFSSQLLDMYRQAVESVRSSC
jgi:glycosyltransferase involved in cell wall biosynthesis